MNGPKIGLKMRPKFTRNGENAIESAPRKLKIREQFWSEVTFIKKLETQQHNHLLLHPLIQIFLLWKHNTIKNFQRLYEGIRVAFMITLTCFAFYSLDVTDCLLKTRQPNITRDCLETSKATKECLETEDISSFYLNSAMITSSTFTVFFLILLMAHEILQLCHQRLKYFSSTENLFELPVVITTAAFIGKWLHFKPEPDTGTCYSISDETVYELATLQAMAAFPVFGAWFLYFLNGTRFTIGLNYKIMFINLLTKLAKFLFEFLPIILGFFLAFSILRKNAMFDTVYQGMGISFVKGFVMLIGEIDFDAGIYELDDNNLERPVRNASIVFLVAFLLVVNLILSNLIIGLAVNVSEEEEKKSKIFAAKYSLQRIREIEHILSLLNGLRNRLLFSKLDKIGLGKDYSDRISFFPNRPADRFLSRGFWFPEFRVRCYLTSIAKPHILEHNEKLHRLLYLPPKLTETFMQHIRIRNQETEQNSLMKVAEELRKKLLDVTEEIRALKEQLQVSRVSHEVLLDTDSQTV